MAEKGTKRILMIMCVILLAIPVSAMASPPAAPLDLIPYPEIGPTLYGLKQTAIAFRSR